MFKTVLVPVDLSDQNAASVAMAAKLTDPGHGTLHLLHVIELIPGLGLEEERAFYDRLERDATAHLARLSRIAEKEKRAQRADVLFGARGAVILNEAERLSADLLVMRSHRVGRTEPYQGFGTLSHQIGILASCPVLLVK